MRNRVVVVDDDTSIGFLIRDYLKDEGFNVSLAIDGREALDVIEDRKPDIVILDLMLPKLNGLEALRILRERSSVPVIALSARGEINDKATCLNLGADDYMTKPFGLEELLARIGAVLRRTRTRGEMASTFSYKDIFIDYDNRQVKIKRCEIQFSPLEYSLLRALTQNAGKVLSYEYLLNSVWGEEYKVEREYLHVYVRQLRSKIERDPKNPEYIVTIPRVGYKFTVDISKYPDMKVKGSRNDM